MSYLPPGGHPPPPQPLPKKSHVLELVVGSVLGAVDLAVSGVVGVSLVAVSNSGALFLLGPLLGLLLPVALMFSDKTRWWGVGILIGFFVSLIVLGGACVALIASLGG